MSPAFRWRGEFDNSELNALHAEAFGHPVTAVDWWGRVEHHSLGWVTARHDDQLIGFVNVAWDGGEHAFVLDTMVATSHRRLGIGGRLVEMAVVQSRAAGCRWLHVDFEPYLRGFYLDTAGFTPTGAGLISL